MISIPAAAEATGRPARTIRLWCSRGLLARAHKIGRDWLVDLDELRRFVPPKPTGRPRKTNPA
jgi:hypothetical protein